MSGDLGGVLTVTAGALVPTRSGINDDSRALTMSANLSLKFL
jgi:hypothetical protein